MIAWLRARFYLFAKQDLHNPKHDPQPNKASDNSQTRNDITPIRVRQQNAKQRKLDKDWRWHQQQKLVDKSFNHLHQFGHISFLHNEKVNAINNTQLELIKS